MGKVRGLLIAIVVGSTLSGCGTTFELPELGEQQTQRAKSMFAEAHASGSTRRQLSVQEAERRFTRVARRIEPVGRSFCGQIMGDRARFNCSVDIAIDRKMDVRNAYFSYESNEPVIRISMPMLRDTVSDDEVAFILSHEYGHLVGRHIEKQQQQAVAGAIVLGAIMGAATAQHTAYGTYYDQNAINAGMDIGAAAGGMAYSQTYELESDTLGTRIAHAAGYNPIAGAQFFARPEDARTRAGNLSFWGTHPPDEKRVATVLSTVAQIDAGIGLRRVTRSAE